jgi:NAD(P)-dependent dehydrogenase (short-subunit alcohol dehydrogenase family)
VAVTGGCGGIGLAVCSWLAAGGAMVYALDLKCVDGASARYVMTLRGRGASRPSTAAEQRSLSMAATRSLERLTTTRPKPIGVVTGGGMSIEALEF